MFWNERRRCKFVDRGFIEGLFHIATHVCTVHSNQRLCLNANPVLIVMFVYWAATENSHREFLQP